MNDCKAVCLCGIRRDCPPAFARDVFSTAPERIE